MPPPGRSPIQGPEADRPSVTDELPRLTLSQADRRILSASPGFCAWTGWREEALRGVSWQRVFAPECFEAVERTCARGTLVGASEADAQLRLADGRRRGALLRVHFDHRQGVLWFLLQPADDGQAAPPSAASAPAALPGEGTTVMQALNVAGAAALEVDSDGSITDATPAVERLLGQEVSALRLLRIEEVFAMSEPAKAAFQQARQRHQPQSVLAACMSDSRQVVVEWLAGSRPGSGYAVVMGPHRDMVGMERLRMQSQLVSLVAHDVRDSLSAVNYGLQTLSEDLGQDSDMQDTVIRVLRENERAARIAHDVLWMSRPGDLERVELDVDTVVHEAAERFRDRAAKASIDLVLDLASGAHVLADLSSLDRVLGNLIDNAIDATPAEGRVTLSTRRESRGRSGVRISVSDTGTGIQLEDQPVVFDFFVTKKPGGNGLGLAIARRVALDHDGHIDFDSLPGQGTNFHLWLPALGE
jgi:signal transduction histidine kinase